MSRFLISWLVPLVVTVLLYFPGLSGTFHFDDAPNFGGLEQVRDFASAWEFVWSGRSSSIGRPVALASFLLNSADWPGNPRGFLVIGLVVHILNVMLVFFLGRRLAAIMKLSPEQADWAGGASAILWGGLPILASTTLMPVQRMTSLATTFVMLSLLVYLWGRMQQRLGRALLAFSIFLLLCGLGILTKENAVLIPLLVVLVEVFFLKSVRWQFGGYLTSPTIWLGWLPSIALLCYLVFAFYSQSASYETRYFTLIERAMTEPRVIFSYLGMLLFPSAGTFTPFHDGFEVSKGLLNPPSTILSISGCIFILALAIVFRRRFPLFSFAVGWFVIGHLLESTLFSLELMFEHRNYLSLIGLCLAVGIGVHKLEAHARNRGRLIFILLVAFNAFVLFMVTSIWGQPLVAAEVWVERYPNSERAVSYLADKWMRLGQKEKGLESLQSGAERMVYSSGLQMQALEFSCGIESSKEQHRRLVNVRDRMRSARPSNSAIESFSKLISIVHEGKCPGVSLFDLIDIAMAFEENPTFLRSRDAMSHIEYNLGEIAVAQNRKRDALQNYRNALQYSFLTEALINAVFLSLDSGQIDLAESLIKENKKSSGFANLRDMAKRRDIESLAIVVAQSRLAMPGYPQNKVGHDR